jgi:hypothetical protein
LSAVGPSPPRYWSDTQRCRACTGERGAYGDKAKPPVANRRRLCCESTNDDSSLPATVVCRGVGRVLSRARSQRTGASPLRGTSYLQRHPPKACLIFNYFVMMPLAPGLIVGDTRPTKERSREGIKTSAQVFPYRRGCFLCLRFLGPKYGSALGRRCSRAAACFIFAGRCNILTRRPAGASENNQNGLLRRESPVCKGLRLL